MSCAFRNLHNSSSDEVTRIRKADNRSRIAMQSITARDCNDHAKIPSTICKRSERRNSYPEAYSPSHHCELCSLLPKPQPQNSVGSSVLGIPGCSPRSEYQIWEINRRLVSFLVLLSTLLLFKGDLLYLTLRTIASYHSQSLHPVFPPYA